MFRKTRGIAVHAGMLLASAEHAGDPHYPLVSSLLSFDGANGATTIVDAKGATWSPTLATLSTTRSMFGVSSLSKTSDGTSGLVRSSGAALGAGQFCVEGWVHSTTDAYSTPLFDCRNGDVDGNGFALYLRPSRRVAFYSNAVGTPDTGSILAPIDTWAHLAATRDASNTLRIFLGGQLAFTMTNSSDFNRTSLYIGRFVVPSQTAPAHMDEFRLTIGAARYTSNFAVPTSAFPRN